MYVDFDNAFEDQTQNDESFGFQPLQSNVHLQSVEMISEVQNTHFRFYSRPSTPSDTPPYLSRNSPHSQQSMNNTRTVHFAPMNQDENLPPSFSSDAIRSNPQQDDIHSSTLSLPQYFLVKYLGRTPCTHLWGTKTVRTPIDEMVRNARQLPSINELPTLEACVNTRGLTLTHRQSPTRHKQQSQHHGLIPLDHISYAMHDVKYSKIATCIVLRQMKSNSSDEKSANEMFMECYTFLFQSKEHAHRFARTFAQAFSQSNSHTRSSRANLNDKGQGRSRHRSNHQRMHYAGKSNDHHHRHHRFFDSQA